jgi:hypothetical protein
MDSLGIIASVNWGSSKLTNPRSEPSLRREFVHIGSDGGSYAL